MKVADDGGAEMRVYGRTAVYARKLRRKAAANMLAATYTAIPAAIWWSEQPTSPVRSLIVAVAVGIVAAGVYDASRAFDRARAGIRSEDLALEATGRSRAKTVVCSARIPGVPGDVDQVILEPVVAAVEVKTGRGQITVHRGQLRARGRAIHGGSLGRARKSAERLTQISGQPTAAIICIVGMRAEPFTAEGVTICSPDDLPQVIDRLPDGEVRDIPAVIDTIS